MIHVTIYLKPISVGQHHVIRPAVPGAHEQDAVPPVKHAVHSEQ